MEILTDIFYDENGLAKIFYIEPVFGCSNVKLATGVYYLYNEPYYNRKVYFLLGKQINCSSNEEFEKILKLKAFM